MRPIPQWGWRLNKVFLSLRQA